MQLEIAQYTTDYLNAKDDLATQQSTIELANKRSLTPHMSNTAEGLGSVWADPGTRRPADSTSQLYQHSYSLLSTNQPKKPSAICKTCI